MIDFKQEITQNIKQYNVPLDSVTFNDGNYDHQLDAYYDSIKYLGSYVKEIEDI